MPVCPSRWSSPPTAIRSCSWRTAPRRLACRRGGALPPPLILSKECHPLCVPLRSLTVLCVGNSSSEVATDCVRPPRASQGLPLPRHLDHQLAGCLLSYCLLLLRSPV